MSDTLELLAKILALILALAGVYALAQKAYRWWRPIRVGVGYSIGRTDEQKMGTIKLSVLNLTPHSQYVVQVVVVGVQRRAPLWLLLKSRQKRPLREWRASRYSFFRRRFEMKPHRKVEPRERLDIDIPLSDRSALGRFWADRFVVRVVLSTGQEIESRDLPTPGAWKDPLFGGPPLPPGSGRPEPPPIEGTAGLAEGGLGSSTSGGAAVR